MFLDNRCNIYRMTHCSGAYQAKYLSAYVALHYREGVQVIYGVGNFFLFFMFYYSSFLNTQPKNI